jgi:hypothetical protein
MRASSRGTDEGGLAAFRRAHQGPWLTRSDESGAFAPIQNAPTQRDLEAAMASDRSLPPAMKYTVNGTQIARPSFSGDNRD